MASPSDTDPPSQWMLNLNSCSAGLNCNRFFTVSTENTVSGIPNMDRNMLSFLFAMSVYTFTSTIFGLCFVQNYSLVGMVVCRKNDKWVENC